MLKPPDQVPRGRPKKLNSHGEAFRKLYLDPLLQPADICGTLGISLKTFYRYEKELNLPKLRAAVLNYSGLPIGRARVTYQEDERYELNVLRAIAPLIGARIKIIPACTYGATRLLQSGAVNLAVACLSKTKERSKQLYTSASYEFEDYPHGYLYGLAGTIPMQVKARPVLGVPELSVHQEFANDNLLGRFELRTYISLANMILDLRSSVIDLVLLHPSVFRIVPDWGVGLEVFSKEFKYNTYSSVHFHRDSVDWLPIVNLALEQLNEANAFEKIYRDSFEVVL